MVRTKGDGGAARTVASKAPRKALGGGGSSGAASRAIASAAGGGCVAGSPAGKYSGGNGYNPQPTPDWQKPLTSFFVPDPNKPPPKMKEASEEGDIDAKKIKGKGKGKKSRKEEQEQEGQEEAGVDEEKENKKQKIERNGVISDSDED